MRTALEIVETEHEAPDDLELIAAANLGDSAAFEALYHKHRDWVVNLAYRFTADRSTSRKNFPDSRSPASSGHSSIRW